MAGGREGECGRSDIVLPNTLTTTLGPKLLEGVGVEGDGDKQLEHMERREKN
jgi:hypothetical protein